MISLVSLEIGVLQMYMLKERLPERPKAYLAGCPKERTRRKQTQIKLHK